ncbi:hypothetical protein RRG08_013715 [Elysia crispata]|uniref:Uncharacterized protein n=1 Tax=Elysia crispata TaxID=231223 RepID=A0AAE0Z998_9GAST|nr:hypothetical protein RRG08_013715 [Elysia crispata]
MLGAHSSSLHLPGGYWIARVSYKKLETGSYPTDAWCPLQLPSPTRWLLDSAVILQETGDWVRSDPTRNWRLGRIQLMLGAHSSSLHLPGGYWIARVSYKKLETGSYPTDAWCPLELPSPTRWLLDSAGILQETGDWVVSN